jgi:hypothetical protein
MKPLHRSADRRRSPAQSSALPDAPEFRRIFTAITYKIPRVQSRRRMGENERNQPITLKRQFFQLNISGCA